MPLSVTTSLSPGICGNKSSVVSRRISKVCRSRLLMPIKGDGKRQCTLQLGAIVHLYQHIHTSFSSGMRQLQHLPIIQGRSNQQHRVGANGPGLYHLVGVYGKVLAQHRQVTGRPGLLQVVVAPWKKSISVSTDRQVAPPLW